MSYYLLQAAYMADAVKDLMKDPQNHRNGAQEAVVKLGGRLDGFWFAFGHYDAVAVCQMPDSVSASDLPMAVLGGGAVRFSKTTLLMTAEEAIEAMKKAERT